MDKRAKAILLKRKEVMECGEPMIWVDEVSVHVVQTRSGRNVLALGREEMGKLNVM